jgi:uncharacterized protein (DUF433 family)
MERLSPQSPYFPYVSIDPDRLNGEPVFRGTRVPIKALFDYLSEGYNLSTFLDHFEGVTQAQAQAVLNLAAGRAAEDIRQRESAPRPLRAPPVRRTADRSRREHGPAGWARQHRERQTAQSGGRRWV